MAENTKPKAAPVIGLLGHTGNQNLGDEAITEATILNFKARLPDATFKLFSISPDDSEARYQYPAYRLRPPSNETVSSVLYRNWQPVTAGDAPGTRFRAPLFEREGWDYTKVRAGMPWRQRARWVVTLLLKAPAIFTNEREFNQRGRELLKDVDLLVVTGSNQFLDNYGGPWAFPYTLLRWSRLAAATGTPLAYASVGAGPIYSRLSLWLLRRALRHADYISVRDEPSRLLLEQGGVRAQVKVCPDLAFSLPDDYVSAPVRAGENHKAVIGINPMPIYHPAYWYVADEGLYKNYVRALAETVIALQEQGHRYFFFATQSRDVDVVADVLGYLDSVDQAVEHPQAVTRSSETVRELLDIVSEADVIVATRFHGTVLALFANKPVLGTCYYRKAADLLTEFGYKDFVMPLEKTTGAELTSGIIDLIARADDLRSAAAPLRQEVRTTLAQQYDDLCALLKP